MKDNRGRVKWTGLLITLALVVTGCNDFFFETPEFDNPHDPKNRDDTINIAAIPGVTAPVTGATPVTTITETAQYTGTAAWNGTPATFAASTVYTATRT